MEMRRADELKSIEMVEHQKKLDEKKLKYEEARTIKLKEQIIKLQKESLAEKKKLIEEERRNMKIQQEDFRQKAVQLLEQQREQDL